MTDKLQIAIEVLNNGGIIIYPTDTAFGIGCRLDNEKAIERLFALRKRPKEMAMPILVNGLDMAKEYADSINQEIIDKLITPFWPGALTIVVKAKSDKISSLVRGGGATIGLRMPNSKEVLEIINNISVPLLGSSANFHGESTPFSVKELNPDLVKLADYVLDGECNLRQSSTVIDVTKAPWKVLRKGVIEVKIS